MSRFLRTAIAVPILFLAGCARTPSLPRATLAVADPSGAESAFTPPPNVLASETPRSHRQELPTRGATDHSGHGVAPTPPPFADPEPTPATATPARTPRPATTAQANYVCPMHPDVRDTKASECPKCGMTLELVAPKTTPTTTPATAAATPTRTPRPEKAQAEYVCPMHPEVRDTKASKCPKCGMTLELVAPKATPTPTLAPRASPTATPAPGGHEHHQRSGS